MSTATSTGCASTATPSPHSAVDVAAVYLELFGRIPPIAREAVEGADDATLLASPKPGANTIAWLVWHSARVQDHYVSEYTDTEQLWAGGDWARRFGLDADPSNTGYGHSADDVAAVRPEAPEVLLEYLDATDARCREFLTGVTEADLDRIVDRQWDPPVTLGARLVSVAEDCLQHVGQAAYVRGLLR
jgi:uncharacterized damage-inducible protein DinB